MDSWKALLAQGLFPETLPPCFTSMDAPRAFRGLLPELKARRFKGRKSIDFIRYNGTKHDRNRRGYGTPNIIAYYYVSDFIYRYKKTFLKKFESSPYALSKPHFMAAGSERAIKVASLSDLSSASSQKLGYAPYILKADVSQFFPSIYTHSIPWAASGKEKSKKFFSRESRDVPFNELDFHVRGCQLSQTRGILIGPDGFRLIAEFISATMDAEFAARVENIIVGGVRHVDDYYIGLKSEFDAMIVLSHLREVLGGFELQLNDNKTRIYKSYEPINELWAQDVRKKISDLDVFNLGPSDIEYAFDYCFEVASRISSDSPIKMLIRRLDELKIYQLSSWQIAEVYLQRAIQFFPHALDYICLLVVKRYSIGLSLRSESWKELCNFMLGSHIAFNHHHETLWILWLMICCQFDINERLIVSLVSMKNDHVLALLLQAFADGKLEKYNYENVGNSLETGGQDWLSNLIFRSQDVLKVSFTGELKDEFEHIASKNIRLIDIDDYPERMSKSDVNAISRVRYGYDDDDSEEDENGSSEEHRRMPWEGDGDDEIPM